MAMNEWLSEMYGTNKVASVESDEQTAQLELFAKLAADNGIDLSELSGDQVNALYAETFGKVAEEGAAHEEHESKKEEAKEEKAKEEHEGHKESAAKLAEADLMGRTMAHAFVSEVNEIEKTARYGEEHAAKAWKAVKGGASDSASFLKRKAVGAGERVKSLLTGSEIGKLDKNREGHAVKSKALGEAQQHWQDGARAPMSDEVHKMVLERAGIAGRKAGRQDRAAGLAGKAVSRERAKVYATRSAAGLGIAGAGAGAAHAAHGSSKESSALDELAAISAVKTAAAAGWDVDEAADLVAQAWEVTGESTKIAYVENTGDAIYVRGLEMLETAGYPVDWTQIFGQ